MGKEEKRRRRREWREEGNGKRHGEKDRREERIMGEMDGNKAEVKKEGQMNWIGWRH
jgi:hypothetical protein